LKCQMQGQNLRNIIEKNVPLAHREEEQAFYTPQAQFHIKLAKAVVRQRSHSYALYKKF